MYFVIAAASASAPPANSSLVITSVGVWIDPSTPRTSVAYQTS